MSSRVKTARMTRWSMVLLLPALLAADATTKPTIFKAHDLKNLKLAIVTSNPSDYWQMAEAGTNKYAN